MPNDLEQDAAGVELGHAPRNCPAGLALQMRPVSIVDAGASGAFDFAADRARRTTKAFSNGPNGTQVIAHSHDDCALLGSQMFVDFASREELLACLDHLLAGAGNASLMTQQLRHTLCDHAAGNYRILTTMAAELLAAAAQRDLPVLNEKLYLVVFAQPTLPTQRRAPAR